MSYSGFFTLPHEKIGRPQTEGPGSATAMVVLTLVSPGRPFLPFVGPVSDAG